MEAVMEIAISTDGTPIAFWRSGTGPTLLLVHGATADHTTTWRLVLEALEANFTVCAMDRRGRGGSGDGASYALAREAEDVAAVVDAIGEPVSLVGHSFGALCGIEAALVTSGIRKLVLYEGVPLRGIDQYPAGLRERLAALVEAGDVEGAYVVLLRDLVNMPPEEIELLRAQGEAWQRRLANAATLPREIRADSEYVFDPVRFSGVTIETLLLVGETSPPREMEHARGVAAALPNASVRVLAGQHHAAMHTAPDLFVREIVEFVRD
jgi:pimeloyl-ACP methyl ester carboxylesterase